MVQMNQMRSPFINFPGCFSPPSTFPPPSPDDPRMYDPHDFPFTIITIPTLRLVRRITLRTYTSSVRSATASLSHLELEVGWRTKPCIVQLRTLYSFPYQCMLTTVKFKPTCRHYVPLHHQNYIRRTNPEVLFYYRVEVKSHPSVR